jgi:sugar/nucleoside kinase (ribokinase family)
VFVKEVCVGKKVLVVGELNVDIIVSGMSNFPKVGQEALVSNIELVLGSSSAICAAGLARLGATVDFVGKVGQDLYGDFVVKQLHQLHVGNLFVKQDAALRTGVTLSLAFSFDRALLTYPGCIPILSLADIPLEILPNYAHLHVGSYFLQQGLRPGLVELFRQAHQSGLTISLDTGFDPENKWDAGALIALLELVDIFIPNEDEARAITRARDTETALRELAKRARLVVVKRGRKGATALYESRILHSPGLQVRSVDTTGAGDSFDAGFIYAYVVRGMPIPEALRFANACGALCTTGYGGTAAQPTAEQVHALLEGTSL